MKTHITVYFGTMLVAMFLVPIISRLAKRYHLVDTPGPRKVHREPIPRIGGIAFVIATFALVLPVFFLNNTMGESFRETQGQLIVMLIAAFFVFLVGLIDDLHPLQGYIKLLCLLGASLAICASSATLRSISIGQWEIETGWAAWPLSVLWIIIITVGMNFIDGLDGLAAGIAAFVCGTIFLLAIWSGQTAMSILMLALMGSVTGFLFFNFYPARIFMGDGGSMFLGFMIGAGSLVFQAKTATFMGLAIPLLVLGIPVFDAAFTMIRRAILYRRSVFSSEMGHIHHYLLDMGLPQLTVVIVIYALTAISASIGLFMLTTTGGWSVALFTGGLVLTLVVFIYLGAARIRETAAAFKRNRIISRNIKEDKRCFEDVQLQIRRAGSFDEWWESIRLMAEKMKFQNMELCLDDSQPAKKYESKYAEENPDDLLAEFVLPVFQKDSEKKYLIKLKTQRNNFLEITCRQIALMGRLVDEFPPPAQIEEKPGIKTDSSIIHHPSSLVPRMEGIPASIDVMGVPVTPFASYVEALECIQKTVESGQKSLWMAVNPQKCYRAWYEPELMEILNQADACICDGVGVSIASKILHGINIRRCTGCDLFFKTLSLASQKEWGVFLLGASPESNEAACAELIKKLPGLKIAGRRDGYFKDSNGVVEQINSSGAKLLFVAMGSPKQEYWMWQHWESLKVNFCMGVGGSLDVASGRLIKSAKIFQKTGTEFVFQLVTEPRKRWPRQKVYFPFMLKIVCKKIFGAAMTVRNNGYEYSEKKNDELIQKGIGSE